MFARRNGHQKSPEGVMREAEEYAKLQSDRIRASARRRIAVSAAALIIAPPVMTAAASISGLSPELSCALGGGAAVVELPTLFYLIRFANRLRK